MGSGGERWSAFWGICWTANPGKALKPMNLPNGTRFELPGLLNVPL